MIRAGRRRPGAFRNRSPAPWHALDADAEARFHLGHAVYNTSWLPAGPEAGRRSGLGPVFNSVSCDACHNSRRRGRGPVGDGPVPSDFVVQAGRRLDDGGMARITASPRPAAPPAIAPVGAPATAWISRPIPTCCCTTSAPGWPTAMRAAARCAASGAPRRCRHCLALAVAMAVPFSAFAADGADAGTGDAFELGRLTVYGERPDPVAVDDDVISRDEMWKFDTLTLDDAIKLTPGVMASQDSNGRRNEHDIFVRGFGRWQVPLSIDGVRIYLPADNRLDFRRFLTADLAEVQVRKGHASVIDGPGAMGGSINLVTRRPTAPFEARFQQGFDFGRDGSYEAWNGYASVGTRQERFYAQASVSYQDRDHWELPGDFEGTSIQARGERDRTATRDSRVNVKFGFVPNDTDEYTLSYTRQDGSKGAPLNVHQDPPNPPNSYWDCPGTSYIRTGQYTLLNLQAQWDVTDQLRVAVGGRNLTDELYELAWGFPQQGRSFYLKMQVSF